MKKKYKGGSTQTHLKSNMAFLTTHNYRRINYFLASFPYFEKKKEKEKEAYLIFILLH
jgi:hypothetical protein